MENLLREIRQSLLLGLVGPILTVGIVGKLSDTGLMPSFSARTVDGSVRVTVLDGEALREMTMDAYLERVLLGEMPASFEEEALKAQAVAARTYTCRAISNEGGKHGGALCTDSACCQAYCREEDFQSQTEENLKKIRQAVADTDGLILTYQGAPIEATFFSASGGRTEDAVAVWGVDYPYLRAVDSPGEMSGRYDRQSFFFSRQELETRLGISLGEDSAQWLGEASFTSGGGIDRLVIGNQSFSGVYLREKLGLPSTAFTATLEEAGLRLDTRGYGHRVGMSQYGANAMASAGADFREILAHYYLGISLANCADPF